MTVTKQDVEDRFCASFGDMEQSDLSLRARIHEIMSPAIRAAATGAATENIPNLAAFGVVQEDRTYVESESILLTAQSPGSQNGVYTVGVVGGGLAALTRRSDLNESAEFEQGMQVPVLFGSGAGDWRLTTANPITLGSTSLTFTRASASGQELRDRVGDTLSPETQIEVLGAKVSKVGSVNRIDLGRFDIREFGAVGDGVTLDDDAFEDALAAIHAAGGGELWIPAGTYQLSKQLAGPRAGGALPKKLVMRGSSRENCRLRFTFAGSGGVGDGVVIEHDLITQSTLWITIEELTIENKSPTNCSGNSASSVAPSPNPGPGSPNITVSGHPYNTLWPSIKIEILTTGASGTATYQASFDGGVIWTAVDLVTSTTARTIPGIGCKVAFPAGTYQDGAIYTWTPTGYAGAGFRMTGGATVTIRGCNVVGWAKGVIFDGTLELYFERGSILNGNNPGVDCVPFESSMGAWFTNGTYIFPVNSTTNNNGISDSAIGGQVGIWHEGGVRHNIERVEFYASTPVCGLFRSPFAVEWSQIYMEQPSPALESSIIEFAQGGIVFGFTLRNSYIANQQRAPLIRAHFPTQGVAVSITDNFITGSPDGNAPHTGQSSLIIGGGNLHSFFCTGNRFELTGAGTILDSGTQVSSLINSHATGFSSRFAINTEAPAASLHVSTIEPTVTEMFRFDHPVVDFPRYSLSEDGTTLLHGVQRATDLVNQSGHGEKCFATTTVPSGGPSTVSVTYPIPPEMCSHCEVTVIVRPAGADDSFYSWRFRIQEKRFGSANALYNGTDDDAIRLSGATVASAQSYTDTVRMMGNPQLVFAEVGGTGDTITRSGGAAAGSFLKDGFKSGMLITSSGTASNNFSRALAPTITDTVITLDTQDLLDAGETITGSVITGGGLDGVTGNRVSPYGRRVLITTGGATPSDAPASATIFGTDIKGVYQTETITIAQTATTAIGLKYFASVTQIDLPAADGTGATLKFGYDGVLLLDTEIDPANTPYATPIVRIHSGGEDIECFLDQGAATPGGRWCVRFDSDQRLLSF